VARDFDEPTDYFQSDLEDHVIGNASEDGEAYVVDWNATTTDRAELGGNLSVGENTGFTFGSSSDGRGGGGGVVAADSGSRAPLALTAVPVIAAVGYAVWRQRQGGAV
jgi:hypothetical protein